MHIKSNLKTDLHHGRRVRDSINEFCAEPMHLRHCLFPENRAPYFTFLNPNVGHDFSLTWRKDFAMEETQPKSSEGFSFLTVAGEGWLAEILKMLGTEGSVTHLTCCHLTSDPTFYLWLVDKWWSWWSRSKPGLRDGEGRSLVPVLIHCSFQ